jgi:outer membrane protein assembly factor BamB
MNKGKIVVALALLSLCASTCVADDWLLARGNLESTGVATSELPASPTELWRYSTGSAGLEGSVVVKDAIAYVGDVEGTIHAIDLKTGKAVWTKKYGDAGFLSSAAIDGDRLFIGDFDGALRCVALADGAERWNVPIEAEAMAGPMIYEGKVLVTTEAGTFTIHNADTGEEVGKFVIDAPLRCTPTIINGRAMLAGCDSKLHAIDVNTAQEVDSVAIDGPTGSTPAARGKMIYFGTEQGTFYAIDTSTSPPTIVWNYADRRRKQGIRTAAAVNDKLAVYGSQGKAVFAVDIETGESKWTFPTRTRVESSPLIAGNVAIAATQRGTLHAIDLESGEETWSFDAGGNFVASPVVVDGMLLIGNTDGTLYAFGEKKE